MGMLASLMSALLVGVTVFAVVVDLGEEWVRRKRNQGPPIAERMT